MTMAHHRLLPVLSVALVSMALGGCSGTSGSEAQTADPGPASPPPTSSGLRVSSSGWSTDFSRTSIDLAEIRSGGPPKDGIPSIDEPRYQAIDEARQWLQARSPVISLEIGGAARAYPLEILTWHEIANDTLGDVPVLVTFCPLCNTALVFDRRLDGTTYDFGTTGNLRFSNLVMYDRQSESWWQQGTGEAIVGTLTGSKLEFLPAQLVSFTDFERSHPDGDVLSRDTGYEFDYGRNPYVGYDSIDEKPFLFDGVVDGRLPPVARVVTVGEQQNAIAFPYSELSKVGVAAAEFAGRAIVVLWAPGTASFLDSAWVYDSADVGATGVFETTVDGQELTFSRVESGVDAPDGAHFVDDQTGSRWTIAGHAVDGPLEGTRLTPVVHGDHFWFSWAAFAPETTIWTAP